LYDPAGKLRGFARIVRDSTAQRTATLEREDLLRRELHARQLAEEASRAKDTFLATISHELRTPLNAMLGWMRMLATGRFDDVQARRAMAIVERNAQAQAQLLAQLLDISRMATGKLDVALQPIALDRVIDGAVEALQHVAVSKGVTIRVQLIRDLATIQGDPDRLQQVMLNVLANAIKFTPAHGTIDVELASEPDVMQITVRDNGQGIAPEFLPHIFDQYQQSERGETPTSGLGLGLAIARHVIELHGGTIEARSDGHGHGATFVVRLPRDGVTLTGSAATLESVKHRPDLVGKRVLIVDDAPEGQSPTAGVLRSCGMQVFTANSVRSALSILNAEAIDVLVSDIRLSDGKDGLDLIRDLRDQMTAAARVRAVAVTNDTNLDDRARALRAGYDLHLGKPIDPSHLIETVTAVLR
jgi:CheY-like chemotaxis protein/nitrogen-specific signal transduction histidine kinase